MFGLNQITNCLFSRKLMNEAGADGADGGGYGGSDNNNNGAGADNSDNGNADNSQGGNGYADPNNSTAGNSANTNGSLSDSDMLAYKKKYAGENGEIDLNLAFADINKFEQNNKAPDEYGFEFLASNESFKDYDIQTDKDPLIMAASQWGKENGVPQDKMETLVTAAMENVKAIHLEQQQQQQQQMQDGWKTIEDGEARKGKLTSTLSGTLGNEMSEVLIQAAQDPKAFIALEQMAKKMRDPVINDNNYQPTRMTEGDASKLRTDRDKALDSGNYAEAERLEKQISGIYKGLAEAGLIQ